MVERVRGLLQHFQVFGHHQPPVWVDLARVKLLMLRVTKSSENGYMNGGILDVAMHIMRIISTICVQTKRFTLNPVLET